jgi:hypothetical protein
MSSLSLVQSCLWTVTRWVPLVQQKLLTFITAHTVQRQYWTMLSELMCCDKGKEFLLHLGHSSCHCSKTRLPCSILSLNSDTMSAPSAAETSYLYHSTWVHSALFNLVFEQWHDWAHIVSLFKDKIEQGWMNSCSLIKVRSFCCTRVTHRVTVQRQDWTRLSEPALFNLEFEQWHDVCP